MTLFDIYIFVFLVTTNVYLLRDYRSAISKNDQLRRDLAALEIEIANLQEGQ